MWDANKFKTWLYCKNAAAAKGKSDGILHHAQKFIYMMDAPPLLWEAMSGTCFFGHDAKL